MTAPPRGLIWASRADRLARGIAAIEDSAETVQIDGTSYATADLDTLTKRLDLYRVKAAIEAIEAGAQSYTLLGRVFTKGDLATLYRREADLEGRAVQRARGGMRVRTGIPTG